MKLNKKIYGIVCSLLLITGLGGCQQKEKEVDEPKNEVVQEVKVDLKVLREEYESIVGLIDHVMFTITNDGVKDFTDALELFEYLNRNRIEPTQELTIQLNNLLDDLINAGIDYYLSPNNDKKTDLANRIAEILDDMQEVMLKIELLLEIENNEL